MKEELKKIVHQVTAIGTLSDWEYLGIDASVEVEMFACGRNYKAVYGKELDGDIIELFEWEGEYDNTDEHNLDIDDNWSFVESWKRIADGSWVA